MNESKNANVSGIILTGGIKPNSTIVDLLKKSKIPVLLSHDDTYTVAAKVEHLICKIQKADKDKIAEASRLVKTYVDVDTILANC
jgi:BioD-like phosphotransacetylase family protein